MPAFRFNLRLLFLLTAIVALNLLYIKSRSDLAVYIPWVGGALVGFWGNREVPWRRVVLSGVAGAVGVFIVAPTALMCDLSDYGYEPHHIMDLEIVGYFLLCLLIVVAIGFLGGCIMTLVLWPAELLSRAYMSIVDRFDENTPVRTIAKSDLDSL